VAVAQSIACLDLLYVCDKATILGQPFRSARALPARLSRSHKVSEIGRCEIRTTGLVCATATRLSARAPERRSAMEAIVRTAAARRSRLGESTSSLLLLVSDPEQATTSRCIGTRCAGDCWDPSRGLSLRLGGRSSDRRRLRRCWLSSAPGVSSRLPGACAMPWLSSGRRLGSGDMRGHDLLKSRSPGAEWRRVAPSTAERALRG
jgi:hypothetical protein